MMVIQASGWGLTAVVSRNRGFSRWRPGPAKASIPGDGAALTLFTITDKVAIL
jgi:hypothetical protein